MLFSTSRPAQHRMCSRQFKLFRVKGLSYACKRYTQSHRKWRSTGTKESPCIERAKNHSAFLVQVGPDDSPNAPIGKTQFAVSVSMGAEKSLLTATYSQNASSTGALPFAATCSTAAPRLMAAPNSNSWSAMRVKCLGV